MESLSFLKSRWLGAALAIASVFALTACGGDEAPEQTLRLSMQVEPSTIDPALASVGNEISIVRQLSSGLFAYDEELNVVAAIAEEIPTAENGGISEDGKTYTIDLKESKWSDGSALTANDFVYSLMRVLDPETASPYAWAFYSIEGAAAYNGSMDVEEGQPAPPASEIEDLRSRVGIKADGDYRIVFTLADPNPSFLNVLTLITSFPVKQSVVEQYGDAWTQVGNFLGNGPFVLRSWEPGSKITLGRNDNWYGPKPTLTTLDVSFIADEAVAYNAYVAGELDAVNASTAALASGQNKDELKVVPLLSTYALFMNNASEVFDDADVRQAFGAAIDRNAYVNGVLQGAGIPTTSWVPPGMPGYDAELGGGMSYNPQAAKALLDASGWTPEEIDFVMVASDRNQLVAQFLEQQLETNLGVEVSFEFLDQGEYFGTLFSGEYDATIQSWFADWPSPDNFLSLFYSKGDANFSFYSNPDFDKLLDDAAAAGDMDTRLELYGQAQAILLDDAGLAPMYNNIGNTFVKPNIANLIITGVDGALKGDGFFWKTKINAPGD